jgi:hypothetical protein
MFLRIATASPLVLLKRSVIPSASEGSPNQRTNLAEIPLRITSFLNWVFHYSDFMLSAGADSSHSVAFSLTA